MLAFWTCQHNQEKLFLMTWSGKALAEWGNFQQQIHSPVLPSSAKPTHTCHQWMQLNFVVFFFLQYWRDFWQSMGANFFFTSTQTLLATVKLWAERCSENWLCPSSMNLWINWDKTWGNWNRSYIILYILTEPQPKG